MHLQWYVYCLTVFWRSGIPRSLTGSLIQRLTSLQSIYCPLKTRDTALKQWILFGNTPAPSSLMGGNCKICVPHWIPVFPVELSYSPYSGHRLLLATFSVCITSQLPHQGSFTSINKWIYTNSYLEDCF